MHAASDQSGHVEFAVAPIAGETDTQNTVASGTHLCHPCDVVAHAGHLWNSSHIANSSAWCSATQRRACFRTLLGTSPASKSPFEMRIFAAKPEPLMCTCGGFSS